MAPIYLKSVTGDQRVDLTGEVIAGRSEESGLVLNQGHPSRRHARINARDDGIWLEDLGSTNGTYVNDRPVDAPVKLQPGDRVRFDVEEFDVVDPGAAEATAPDPNATVLRAPPPPRDEAAADAAPPAAEAPAPERQPAPEPAPPKPETREVEGSGGARRPGAWADPNAANQAGTVLLGKDQLEALLSATNPSPQPLADADAPYLVVTAGAQAGTTLKLKSGQQTNVWDIGRDAGRDIRFDEDGVSGFHAKIVNEGTRWKVIDQMSANGTLVNEKRGTISFLSPGDRIRFGPVECVFQLPAGAKGTARRPAASGRSPGRTAWVIGGVVMLAAIAAAAYYLLV